MESQGCRAGVSGGEGSKAGGGQSTESDILGINWPRVDSLNARRCKQCGHGGGAHMLSCSRYCGHIQITPLAIRLQLSSLRRPPARVV
ncbi:hypothetical protein J6590_038506 [Homalodisca vitripennis]|nr:hypothetical protein J6590_038506 [Homalodisca vitripennis]